MWSTQLDSQRDDAMLAVNLVYQLFEAQVEKTPVAIALEHAEQTWTYQQLNHRANQLAHHLRSQGVEPETLVGLYLERSLEMIVGLLAILKAGGAYVPLDPTYPAERLAWMLEDSRVSVLLTQKALVSSLPAHTAKLICLDADWSTIAQANAHNPVSLATANNLAYVIYTSGSTGKPKGVMIEQAALLNFVQGASQVCSIQTSDRVLQFASISFDTAIEEIFLTFSQGATLVLRTPEMLKSVQSFLEDCCRSKITVLDLPSAFWHQICAELGTTIFPATIRLVIIGGERALPNCLEIWKQYVQPEVQLINSYGPTESTVVATYCALTGPQAVPIHAGIVPIGKALANFQTYVLDAAMQPVKLGDVGELYLGGLSLARGYLNQPGLTDDRFIFHTLSGKPSIRLYKTGDLVRCREDGHLEFINRIDHQEKIRGFRVELSEIESALEQHAAVQEAIVIAREDNIGVKRLVAYIVQSFRDQVPMTSMEMTQLEADLIDQWRLINNSDYLNPVKAGWDSSFNISGWVNSYTGDLIPDIEMQEWVDTTIARILALNPRQVLEIGCGTGLLLFRIAPQCHSYLGIDISETSLAYIQQQLTSKTIDLPQVTLEQRAADNFEGIEAQSFDTIIINSVIQYFPSVDYLIGVLRQALKALKPGGTLFIGDVRNHLLLEMFATMVELTQASDDLPTQELCDRIQKRLSQEEELTLDPNFFVALQQCLPEISQVQILLKRGKHHNELSQFRYDVLLQIGSLSDTLTVAAHWLDWQAEGLTLTRLRHLLETTRLQVLGIRNIPNQRTLQAAKAVALLHYPQRAEKVNALKQSLNQDLPLNQGIDPEDVWRLSQGLPYQVEVSWRESDRADGSYQAIFKQQLLGTNIYFDWLDETQTDSLHPPENWYRYANNPLHSKITQDLAGQLRAYLKERLPEYMLPSAFVVLEKLPLTPNGKVNRRALPAPDLARPALKVPFVAAQTPLEQSLAEIWSKILEVTPIGVNDSFFELGGDSLRLMQLFAQLKKTFSKEIPFTSFFNHPTVAGLALTIKDLDKVSVNTVNERISLQDLSQEVILDLSMQPSSSHRFEQGVQPQSILLTGATGFIGISLLHELLQQTEATIYCLIRAQSLTQAYQKLRYTTKRYLPGVNFSYSRIIPVIGDLSQVLLGLSKDRFQTLAETIDMIYHSAANVNLFYPLASLKSVNIVGTKSILQLASHAQVKPVHFISTLDVFEPLAATGVPKIYESDDIAQGEVLTGGYAQSKWIAEQLVTKAAEQGIPTCIYRPGMVTGHSQTGAGNPEDLLSRFLKSLIQMKAAPNLDLKIDMTPVDYVSKAIVYLSQKPTSLGKAFHLVNPAAWPLEKLVYTVNELGYTIEQIPYQKWETHLNKEFNALSPLSQVITEILGEQKITRLEMWLSGTQLFDDHNTLDGLHNSNISCPTIDRQLVGQYLGHLGFD